MKKKWDAVKKWWDYSILKKYPNEKELVDYLRKNNIDVKEPRSEGYGSAKLHTLQKRYSAHKKEKRHSRLFLIAIITVIAVVITAVVAVVTAKGTPG